MKKQLTVDEYFAAHLNACPQAKEWASQFKTASEAWQKCERADWMLWMIEQDPKLAKRIGKGTVVGLAVKFAERALPEFEKKYPDDKRPREAVSAAKRWIKNPTKKNRDAANAAYAAAYAANAANAAKAAYAAANAAANAAYAAERLWQAQAVRRAIKNPFKGKP